MELARLLNGRPGAERMSLPALLDGAGSGLIDQRTHRTALPVVIARVEGETFPHRQGAAGAAGRSI